MNKIMVSNIIDHLWKWVTTYKGRDVIKDCTGLINAKFDCYLESTASNPLSFTVFELSEKGEVIIDDVTRISESEAAFYLFVNSKTGWILAIKNNLENQKKLVTGEAIQNIKVRIVPK
ncbi:MAG: hypothetical protein WCK67_05090 [bacterium]